MGDFQGRTEHISKIWHQKLQIHWAPLGTPIYFRENPLRFEAEPQGATTNDGCRDMPLGNDGNVASGKRTKNDGNMHHFAAG